MSRTFEEIDDEMEIAFHNDDALSLSRLSEEMFALDTPESNAQGQICKAQVLLLRGHLNESLAEYTIALRIVESNNDQHHIAIVKHVIGVIYYELSLYPLALEWFIKARLAMEENGEELGQAAIFNTIAGIYLQYGMYVKAFEYFDRALTLFKRNDELRGVIMIIKNMAAAQHAAGQHEEALKNYSEVLAAHSEIGDLSGVADCLKVLGDHCLKSANHKKAFEYFTTSADKFESLGYELAAIDCKIGIAKALVGMGHINKAKIVLSEVTLDDIENMETKYDLLRTLAKFETTDGHLDKAAEILNELLSFTRTTNLPRNTIQINQDLRDLAALRNDPNSYIHHNNEAVRIAEEIHGAEVQIKMALISKEHEIELERQQRDIERVRRIQAEKELALKTAHLGTQIELVAAFKKQLQTVLVESSGAETAIKRVREKLDELQDEQIDWVHFEREFVELHPEFVSAIRMQYPALTKQEVKMCQLIRIGLKSHEIANILCLSERSIENHRFNLRKKLGLNSSDKLHDIVGRIS